MYTMPTRILHPRLLGLCVLFQPQGQWTLFIIRLRLLFYFVFRTRSICFHNIYRLQMALGV